MKNTNRIIPQMFDVRPVDQAGDLDWKKIQSMEKKHLETKKRIAMEKSKINESVKAYFLGVGIEHGKAPIFHEASFDMGEICRKENEYQQYAPENQKNIQGEYWQRMYSEREEKEAALLAEKIRQQNEREETMRFEAFRKQEEIKKITQYNRERHLAYTEAVKLERAKREREEASWLKAELKNEKRARKQEKIEKIKIRFSGKNSQPEFSWRDMFSPPQFSFQFNLSRALSAFAVVALVISLGVGGVSYASKGFGIKGKVLGASQDGMANLTAAISDMKNQNFESSAQQFSDAYANFSKSSQQLNDMGGMLLDVTRFIPFASQVSSGKNVVEAGKHFSVAGQSLNEVVKTMAELKNPIDSSQASSTSLLDVFQSAEKNIAVAKIELAAAQQNINMISIDDLPKDKQDEFLLLKQNLPDIISGADLFLNNSHIFVDLLGGNGPRKYLFLFQNNSEMRATGGFIGSYGLLDIADGHVKKFFIDGIFNPDGQLKDKIVPPDPIQKISAAWSLHDSNWFPDFPTSARKAIYFYEKTGGPTADGVITFTPTLMQKLLEITGPIEMPEYNVTLDAANFIEMTQYKVEVDYDKEDNQPKKILADLAPLVLEKLLSNNDLGTISKTLNAFMSGLAEKHVLLYSQNQELENIIKQQGWSGEILPSAKDYISVINTNINGFKTDAIIDENIDHKAEIQADGSIVDTVTITRKHNGGDSQYDWLNKVNANYMRVYVPQGSKLLEVNGQTKEIDKSPLDYDALGFKRDRDVQNEENNTIIDPESGTRIYDEAGKTVFANWTYVSPQETMTITYKYLLPFTLFKISVGQDQQVDSYSLVAQKQSGSVGSSFVSHVAYPANYAIKWNMPDDIEKNANEFQKETVLKTDYFEGVVFEKK